MCVKAKLQSPAGHDPRTESAKRHAHHGRTDENVPCGVTALPEVTAPAAAPRGIGATTRRDVATCPALDACPLSKCRHEQISSAYPEHSGQQTGRSADAR